MISVRQRKRGETRFGPAGGSLWYIANTDDPANEGPAEIRAAVGAQALPSYDGFDALGVEASEIVTTPEYAYWLCEVRYGGGSGFAALPVDQLDHFTGALVAEQMHKSFAVIGSGGPAGTPAPNRGGLIAVNDKGESEGVPVLRPVFTPGFSARLPANAVENTHIAAWVAAFGTVNGATWKVFPAGTLLFQGLQAERLAEGGYSVRLEFGYRRNVSNFAIGDEFSPINIEGWDHLEIVGQPDFDDAQGVVIARPKHYYIHRIYERSVWGDLGI